MTLPIRPDGGINWHEWHSRIARENITIALAARESARGCRPDKYLTDAVAINFYRRKAVAHIKIANAHAKAAKGYVNDQAF